MYDKVVNSVRQNGPSLPVEVASAVNSNSFLAKAYLEECVERGLLKRSPEKIGESYVYFASGQEEAVKGKIAGLNVKKTARTYADKEVAATPEVMKKREAFDGRLKEIESREEKEHSQKQLEEQRKVAAAPAKPINAAYGSLAKHSEPANPAHAPLPVPQIRLLPTASQQAKPPQATPPPQAKTPEPVQIMIPKQADHGEKAEAITAPTLSFSPPKLPELAPIIAFRKPEVNRGTGMPAAPKLPKPASARQQNPKKEEYDAQRDGFVERAIGMLMQRNIELLEKAEKGKNADLVVNVPTAVGAVKFLVKVRNKKKISKNELVEIYAEALEQRTPAILLTNAELAKASAQYLKAVGGFLRVKVL